ANSYYSQALQRDEPRDVTQEIDFLTTFVAQPMFSRVKAKADRNEAPPDSNVQPAAEGGGPEQCSEAALQELISSTAPDHGGIHSFRQELRNRLDICRSALDFDNVPGSTCTLYANTYRTVVNEAISASPPVPESASEDLKRACAGSLSVLDIMRSHSIAKTNDALLAMRPVFLTDTLDEFRQEIIHFAEKDDEEIRKHAQTHLAKAVTVGNALDACLYNAAAPEDATEDVEVYEYMNEYEDINEYEDMDEEDECEEDEDETDI
ncbi:hypothetical protein BGZ70_007655, partial [Mortierella alpina]